MIYFNRLLMTLVIFGGGVAASHIPARARAYCLEAGPWWNGSSIPVFHAQNLYLNLLHPDGTAWTESELTNEIQWMLQTINFYSDSNLPPLYDAGPRSPCSGEACRIGNAITIIPNETSSCGADTSGDTTIGQLIRIPRHFGCDCDPGPGVSYCSYYTNFNSIPNWYTRAPLYGTVIHELGHAIGLYHSHDLCDGVRCTPTNPCTCSASPCSVMSINSGNPYEAMTWYKDDVLGLRAIYGSPSYPYRIQKESTDGTSWYSLTSSGLPPFQPLFGLSSSTTASMFGTYRDASTMMPRAFWWDWGPPAWHDWGSSGSYTTQGQTGAAWDPGTSRGWSAYLRDETQTEVRKHFGLALHSGGSAVIYSWSGAATRRHGVSLAHDPKTNARVQVWRGSQGQIEIQPIDGATFITPWQVTDGTGAAYQAIDTPSVACGDSILGLNCVVAWADAAREGSGLHSHILRWAHFSMNRTPSWSITVGPVLSDGHIMYGTPMVSYRGPALATYPFEIAWVAQVAAAQYAVFTAAKGGGSSATWNWSTLVEHGPYSSRMAAGLGSANNDLELLIERRSP